MTDLKRLLKQLHSRKEAGQEEAYKFSEEQKRTLLALLEKPFQDVELTCAVLKALEQVGDVRALPVVRRLCQPYGKSRTLSEIILSSLRQGGFRAALQQEEHQINRVQQAAQNCLPFLEQRAEQKERQETLLRPSAAVVHPETLLRPMTALPDTEPVEQLLQPRHPVE
jgi:hypothetical protein